MAFAVSLKYSQTTLPYRNPTSVSARRFGLGPGTIALLYAAFSAAWIWASDRIVNAVENSRSRLFLDTSKGLCFVALSALLLYVLMNTLVKRMRRAQTLLATSEAEYRGVVQAAHEGVCRLDGDDRIGFVNPRMAALLHCSAEKLIGLTLSDFLYDADKSAFAEQLYRWRRGATEQHDFRFRGVDGNEIRTIVSGTPLLDTEGSYCGCVLMLMDVTERLRTQEQLQQSQKLEIVGRFAGGIAHDFNNVLGVIVCYAELLKSRHPDDDKGGEYADSVLHSCDRAAALVKQLLAFSRKRPFTWSVIDLNVAVAQFGKMLPRVIGEDVRITIRSDSKPATVRTDPVQVEQVLMNLAVNARDAMPQGGELLIETGRTQGSSITGVKDIPEGTYSYLRVTDSGVGMTAETQSQIFEPFFTTKPVGKGTGLGLSMVYGIVQQSHGYITVASQPERGTTFSMYFPLADALPESPALPAAALRSGRGNETILLVEDDQDLREVTSYILTRQGYRVFEAKNGLDALAICEKQLAEIDLVLTDLVMPHMGGRELASRLAQLQPALKIAFVSGYADDRGDLANDFIIIEKPTSPDLLLKKIRRILDSDLRQDDGSAHLSSLP